MDLDIPLDQQVKEEQFLAHIATNHEPVQSTPNTKASLAIKANLAQIFDCTSDNDLSDAPTTASQRKRTVSIESGGASARQNVETRKASTSIKTKIPLVSHEHEIGQDTAPDPKRRKIASNGHTFPRGSPASPLSVKAYPQETRPHSTVKKYGGARKSAIALPADDSNNSGEEHMTAINFDIIPATSSPSLHPLHPQSAKKRGLPRKSRPTRSRRAHEPLVATHSTSGDDGDMEEDPRPRKRPVPKRNAKRIMSDLEPALSQSVSRRSRRGSPPASKDVGTLDIIESPPLSGISCVTPGSPVVNVNSPDRSAAAEIVSII